MKRARKDAAFLGYALLTGLIALALFARGRQWFGVFAAVGHLGLVVVSIATTPRNGGTHDGGKSAR